MEPLDGRVIVATFASNIARIQQVLDAAADVRPQGRGHRPVDGAELPDRDRPRLPQVRAVPDRGQGQDQRDPGRQAVIATTGAQGEPMAGLARMANRDHRFVEIQPGDTVIVSASPIPGNEEYVARTIDNLFKAGANVFYHTIKRAHVSGHASQEELKLMLGLTKPKHFIPIHGEFRMLVQHGRLAIETGRPARERLHHRERHADRVLRGRHRAARHARRGGLRVRRRPVRGRGRRRRPARPARPRERRHVHDRRHGRQADRPDRRPARDHHPRLRPRHRGGPDHRRGDPPRPAGRRAARATASARSPCSRSRSRTASRASCTSRRSGGRWSSRSWWRSRLADAPHLLVRDEGHDPTRRRRRSARARRAGSRRRA